MRIRKGYVEENALENREDPHGVDGDADETHDPVNVAVTCPGKKEETDGYDTSGTQSGDEPIFRGAKAMGADGGVNASVEVEAVCRDDQQHGDGYGEKRQALFAER